MLADYTVLMTPFTLKIPHVMFNGLCMIELMFYWSIMLFTHVVFRLLTVK
uniref:Uncharacterized protein n=1 Tax=Arundo donax TaxID=35708 RepID=A0A0A9EF80_ARUDO